MHEIPGFVVCVLAAFGYAAAAEPILRRSRTRFGAAAAVVIAVGVLLGPLLISSDKIVLRALASLACAELMFKMVDYARRSRQGGAVPSSADYYRFLIPFPFFLLVMSQRGRRLSQAVARRREILRVFAGLAVFAASFGLVHLVSAIEVVRSRFALDHAIKLTVFVVAIESLSRAVHGIDRWAGYDTPPPMRSMFLSRTVAEFWRRYNTRVHAWLDRNVFRPGGGRRTPGRGLWLVFLASAVLHEMMFAIATSRVDGYQFAFFMAQAPAAMVSPTLERFARRSGVMGKTLAHGLTVLWFYLTSMLFFHGVDRVFPFFYASDPWLP